MYNKKEILTILLVLSIPFFSSARADSSTPGDPKDLTSHTAIGNFWVNYTWSPGANTDSFNVSVNRNWTNGTKDTFINTKSIPHGWVNISVAGYNEASQQLSSFIHGSAQVPNNPIVLTDVSSHYSLYEGQTLYIDANYTDLDNDIGIFATTAKGEFDSSTGILSWKPAAEDMGKNWEISVIDRNSSATFESSTASQTFTLTIDPNVPERPRGLSGTTTVGSFWVNYTWSAGANTDSFNVNVNGNWTNGTKDTFINTKSIPHGWVNISVAGYNATSKYLSDTVTKNIQVLNNPITLTDVKSGYFMNEGETLYIDANYTDLDNDKGIFATTAKGGFDSSTGILSWPTRPGDGGVYNWLINVTDGYGSFSTQKIKVVIPLQLTIKFVEPTITDGKEQWIGARTGHIGKYMGAYVTFKNTGEDSLKLSITEIYNDTRYKLPIPKIVSKEGYLSYRTEFEINSSGVKENSFNYTYEVEVEGFRGEDFTFSYRNTTILSLPMIPINKIKRANPGKDNEPIYYTLEANSSVDLIDVSIYDALYPDKYFNISKLNIDGGVPKCYDEANNLTSCRRNYSYLVNVNDLSRFGCEVNLPCVINLANFTGKIKSSGKTIEDSEYVEILISTGKSESSTSRSSSSSGGGGGGGGGMPPSEDFNNIERREVREMFVLAKSATAYTFKSADPVMAVSFESSVSENDVPVAVEVLKNRSKHIGVDAPGNLYRYFNIFVGVSGFSKKVGNGVVVFRVNNSWLEENGQNPKDIKLYKWQGDGWIEKNTEIVENKQNQTYYASLVGNFSSFVISAVKKQATATPDTSHNSTGSANNSSQKTGDIGSPVTLNLIMGLITIVLIGSIYYIKIKNNKK